MAQAQAVKDSQRKATEACTEEVASLTKIDRDNLFAEDLIKLGEKLNEAMGMKKRIEEESNREVESRVGDKKQVVNGKILKTGRIVVAHINLIDGKGKVELEKAVGETSKLLDELAWTNRKLEWKVKAKVAYYKEGASADEEETRGKEGEAATEEGPFLICDMLQLLRKAIHQEELYVSKQGSVQEDRKKSRASGQGEEEDEDYRR